MKKIISYIFSFILAILIILICFFTILKSTVMSKEYVISKLESANYFERINEEIIEQFKNYTIQSGLTDSVLENLFTPEKLEKDIKNVINSIYTGEKLEIDTSEIKENLKENILSEVEKEGKTVDFQDESIKEYLSAIENAYESQVSYSTSTVNSIGNTFSKILKIFDKVDTVLYIIAIVLALIIVILNIKDIIGVKYIATSLMASGIFILLIKILIETNMNLQNIMIINQASTNVLQLIIKDVLGKILTLGSGLTIVGVVSCLIYNILKKERQD